ncbi:hypothetical protein EYC08_01230 [Tabrizicola sp. WMC-M-20]|nr:hypothetical protein EYC08_01230 [Tabrizicola sp. WMC-M-20]
MITAAVGTAACRNNATVTSRKNPFACQMSRGLGTAAQRDGAMMMKGFCVSAIRLPSSDFGPFEAKMAFPKAPDSIQSSFLRKGRMR